MRIAAVPAIAASWAVLTAGCAQPEPSVVYYEQPMPPLSAEADAHDGFSAGPLWEEPLVTPALLFDRRGGWPTAGQMAYRSDWPSTSAMQGYGESIYYRERFIDIQRATPFGGAWPDLTYRRFETFREGFGVR